MNTLEILTKARELIAHESRWCVGQVEKLASDGTRQYCAIGAMHKVANGYSSSFLRFDHEAYRVLADQIPAGFPIEETMGNLDWQPPSSVAQYNNRAGHTATIKMFDDAIVTLRRKETVDALLSQAVENAAHDTQSLEIVG